MFGSLIRTLYSLNVIWVKSFVLKFEEVIVLWWKEGEWKAVMFVVSGAQCMNRDWNCLSFGGFLTSCHQFSNHTPPPPHPHLHFPSVPSTTHPSAGKWITVRQVASLVTGLDLQGLLSQGSSFFFLIFISFIYSPYSSFTYMLKRHSPPGFKTWHERMLFLFFPPFCSAQSINYSPSCLSLLLISMVVIISLICRAW